MHESALVWEGIFEVFQLARHPKAKRAYAWSEATTGTKRRFSLSCCIWWASTRLSLRYERRSWRRA